MSELKTYTTEQLEQSRKVCTCPDTSRYASLGDAMTVNVMEWIARRMREEML